MPFFKNLSNYYTSNPKLLKKQTIKMPIWYLFLISILYVCYGFFNRDPWKNEDLIGFSSIYTLLKQPIYRWWELINNLPNKTGQIYYIFSAIIAKFLVFLDVRVDHSIRIGSILLIFTSIYFIWKTTFHLALHKNFIPYEYPLGGQPSIKNYAYTIANISVLMYCSSIGSILRLHETTPFIFAMLIISILIYGLVNSYKYTILALSLFYAFGHSLLFKLSLTWCLYIYINKYLAYKNENINFKLKKYLFLFSILLFIAYLISNIYIYTKLPTWDINSIKTRIDIFITQYPTFTWPLLPFSLYAYLAWYKNTNIRYFFLFNLSIISLFIFDTTLQQAYFLYLIPILCILSSFAFAKISISLQKSIITFSIFGFTSLILILWIIWGAWQLNYALIVQLSHVSSFITFRAIFFAIFFSGIWIISIYLQRKLLLDPPLWLGAYFMAIGLSCSWIVIVHLWLPAVNQIKTYRYILNTLNNYIGNECASIDNLQAPQLASLVYMSNFRLGNNCPFLITYTPYKHDINNKIIALNYSLIWQGHRLLDKDEMFYLWKLNAKNKIEM